MDPGIYKGGCWPERSGSVGGSGASSPEKFSNSGLILLLYSGQVTMQISGRIYYCTVAVIQVVV